ncbi:hypothetical protein PHLGIDRAFT_487418 [Phlebiopsis gigantea 11061_1 CR5-6]|uniref:N-acetyltransferase domain-containing protein n=1 Tax=Phlebiopsis gigantea (strain 11061_1 CR5-6) TaxID=745531 RepID=A0A0C3PI77_PHLG1|nr:hypothetical protein PHLGIDRAFT_487418 [Phlebiopsis gigantea 11061_1 CR5-6]
MNEFQKKLGAAVQEALGSRVDSMLEVGGLATLPDWQGHGYATALIRTVTDNGDRTNRSCWLGSSNTVNRGFYRSLGFEIVHTFQLGDDNPDWHEKPVLFDIMVRELKQDATGDIV